MAAPPGQFIALQTINVLKETISGQYKVANNFAKSEVSYDLLITSNVLMSMNSNGQ